MAYNNKYKITMATKSGSISTLYLQEDGYVGSEIEYPAVSLQIQYIPRSDDIFEAIYVSQLNVIIDVTDDLNNMPDFTTLNDRKYLCKLFYDNTLEWQGWALSDYVQFSYTTGRKELSFNAIDGLGMLEKIPYQLPVDYSLVDRITCLKFLQNSLSNIGFNLNLISGISLYATSMLNRSINTFNEPLIQSFQNYASITDDNQVAYNSLRVISDIAKGFGCRFYQAQGKWYIVPLTQFAQSSYFFTEYNPSGTVVTSGTKTLSGEIQGYNGNTSNLFYVDNSQFKIIRKGFNKIRFEKQIEYPNNYITNWDLKNYTFISPTEGDAFGWTERRETGGKIFVKSYPQKNYNSFIIENSVSAAPFDLGVSPINLPKLGINETFKISFDISGIGVPASGPDALFLLKVTLVTPSFTYFIDDKKQWVNNGDNYYFYPFDAANAKANFVLESQPAPDNGVFDFELILADGSSPYWKSTVAGVEIQNFNLEIVPSFSAFVTESFVTDTDEYVLDIDLPLGFNANVDGNYSYRGFLSNSIGENLIGWYRYEYPLDIYRSLSELVVKQYSNCLHSNVINIDCSFMGMNTTSGRLSGAMRLTSADIDPAQINVSDKKYILGNSTIDLPNDVITATLLDISPENIETTLTTVYSNNNLSNQISGYGHLRSTAYTTKELALAAPLTTNLIYLEDIGVPSVGDFFYTNEFLNVGFNGANLWWKVLVTDTYAPAYRISGAGEILETFG
jgi:hypothetical protein